MQDLDKYNIETVVLTPYTEFKDMFLIEISRGWEKLQILYGWILLSYSRYKSLDKVLDRAEIGYNIKENWIS